MAETKFTPGPWRVAGKATGRIHYAGNDPKIGSVEIATVGAYRDKELLPFNRERWDADARLILAAPALYEACADASFYLKALGARLAALDLDNTETYGCLKTASMFARTLDAALLLSNTGGTGNG